jgi:hypothetical protein
MSALGGALGQQKGRSSRRMLALGEFDTRLAAAPGVMRFCSPGAVSEHRNNPQSTGKR